MLFFIYPKYSLLVFVVKFGNLFVANFWFVCNCGKLPLSISVFFFPVFPTEISVRLGSSVVLPCSFHLPDTDEFLNATWSFNGSIIASNNQTGSVHYLTKSATGSNVFFPLTLYNATPHSQGVYECHVQSNLTNYFSNVTLIILGKLHETSRMKP